MRSKIIWLVIVFVGIMMIKGYPDEQRDNKDKFFSAIEKCYSMNECGNELAIEIVSKWYFPAEQDNSYGVFGFKFNGLSAKNEEEKKDKEKNVIKEIKPEYQLFIRAYSKEKHQDQAREKTNFLGFSAKMPEKSEDNETIYVFAFPAKAGIYKIIAAITDSNYSLASMTIYDAEFPSFVVSDNIISSSPIFLKKIATLQKTDSVFTVWKDVFHLGIGEIYPYFENKFKADEQPVLFIQLFGLGLDKETSAYNIEYIFAIKKGDEEAVKFKAAQANSPGIVQPVIFRMNNKSLEPGDYLLEISVEDKVSGKKIQKEIPFTIL